MLQRVAVGCRVMQRVAVRCTLLQCGAVCCSVLRSVAVYCSVLQCVAVCCNVSHCVAVRCSVLQCVAVCCSALQCIAVRCSTLQYWSTKSRRVATLRHKKSVISQHSTLQRVAVICSVTVYHNVSQCAAVCCSALQCVATKGRRVAPETRKQRDIAQSVWHK